MSSKKPNTFEPVPRGVTNSELAEMVVDSIKSMDPVEKAVLRASMSGKLGPTSDRIQ
jgi:hypothetical protein